MNKFNSSHESSSRGRKQTNGLLVILIALLLVPLNAVAISPAELAVVININDPVSIQIGDYYRQVREIPEENVFRVSFTPNQSGLAVEEFERVKAYLDSQLPDRIQALALTWMRPYRVGCMSITTAFAAGYDKVFCSTTCTPTRISPYFDSNSTQPYIDFKIRPTMMLAARDFKNAKLLISKGKKSDGTFPNGTAYLLKTTDKNRSVRASLYPQIVRRLGGSLLNINLVNGDVIEGKRDILFYFTGLTWVTRLASNRFLPGAIADHLTSSGEVLDGQNQMSSLRWLEAGATGSYGTVVEPCAFIGKFPHPGVVMDRYLKGETLIEAYWKSVQQPGQGVFIGEPLASPFHQKN